MKNQTQFQTQAVLYHWMNSEKIENKKAGVYRLFYCFFNRLCTANGKSGALAK